MKITELYDFGINAPPSPAAQAVDAKEELIEISFHDAKGNYVDGITVSLDDGHEDEDAFLAITEHTPMPAEVVGGSIHVWRKKGSCFTLNFAL